MALAGYRQGVSREITWICSATLISEETSTHTWKQLRANESDSVRHIAHQTKDRGEQTRVGSDLRVDSSEGFWSYDTGLGANANAYQVRFRQFDYKDRDSLPDDGDHGNREHPDGEVDSGTDIPIDSSSSLKFGQAVTLEQARALDCLRHKEGDQYTGEGRAE